PQWGNQRVSGIVRLGAAFFVLLGAGAGSFVAEHFITSRSLPHLSFDTVFNLTISPYIWSVFLRIALTGKTPSTWLPWR
ncbi:MAG TPA: hypothetical protein VM532_08655, partial [Burkholderiales bacterium]|nr:hypothetical protein [Burkholderiales bacterium]